MQENFDQMDNRPSQPMKFVDDDLMGNTINSSQVQDHLLDVQSPVVRVYLDGHLNAPEAPSNEIEGEFTPQMPRISKRESQYNSQR